MSEEVVKRNEHDVEWQVEQSPKGAFAAAELHISARLTVTSKVPPSYGMTPSARPFEVTLVRIPPGKRLCPRHAHSAQWEYYIVLSGEGRMLQDVNEDAIPLVAGDHVLQPPGWVHTVECCGDDELVYYVIANNPVDETVYYPDSNKWSAAHRVFRMVQADYFLDEE